ncbi:putative phage head protein [Pseudomonas guariconensis]|uniref:putative phage head protein n=1 Tax=Pseudomonas guariconensis TaxID=1288410 RepID=UPI003A4D9F68
MCFKTKVKTPKVSSNIPAPEPVLMEEPKGVEFGDDPEKDSETGKITEVEREGDSSDIPSAFSTAKTGPKKKSTMSSSAVRKSLGKRRG